MQNYLTSEKYFLTFASTYFVVGQITSDGVDYLLHNIKSVPIYTKYQGNINIKMTNRETYIKRLYLNLNLFELNLEHIVSCSKEHLSKHFMKTRLENRAIHTLIWGDLEGIHILNLNAIGHSQLFFFY